MKWLVDTGCTTTIVSTRKFEAIPEDNRPEVEKYDRPLVSTDDTPLRVAAQTVLNIQLGNRTVRHRVIIAEISNEGLIGIDFLVQHKVTLDFGQRESYITGKA